MEPRPQENVYLEQVLQQQEKVDFELRKRAAPGPGAPLQAPRQGRRAAPGPGNGAPSGVDYRVTGVLFWKTVVVPPNVYVVHTRRGRAEPAHIGLGISFRFNPYTDAFLVIPAAMQTIIINAPCICIERQGILVQAYVQWIIDDIRTAYRKLDFSDPEDPMRIVNVQLREQAEAAIKDKVSTMGIDEVLSDKQPIIEELTHRLRAVAEGSRPGEADSSGLGLKIVTVQIKEAVVSSTRLWENLQAPFRAERQKVARMADLEAQAQIAARELEQRQARETASLQTESELAELRARAERAVYDREQAERSRRHELEQLAERRAVLERNDTELSRRSAELKLTLESVNLEERRIEAELAHLELLTRQDAAVAGRDLTRAGAEVELEKLRHEAAARRAERDLALERLRRAIENDVTEGLLKRHLIESLPEIASALPAPKELRNVNVGADVSAGTTSQLVGFLASALSVADAALDGRKRGASGSTGETARVEPGR
jgi:flotillin